MKDEKKKTICCFCGRKCENIYGNSPYPVSKNEKDRCCDYCNTTIVLPKRIEVLISKTNEWKV